MEYGLVDPHSHIDETNIQSLIQEIRREIPFAGVPLLHGSLRSRGIKVTREQIWISLQSFDPLGSALRSPVGLTSRQPYSVPGLNSL